MARKFIILNVEPNEFIEEITFDPRIPDKEYETYSHIINNLGFQNNISKSRLYNFIPLEVSK